MMQKGVVSADDIDKYQVVDKLEVLDLFLLFM